MSRKTMCCSGLLRAFAVALGCVTLVGCGGGGGSVTSTSLSDEFATLSSGAWDAVASVCAIDGGLVLNGLSGTTAEVRSDEVFLHKTLNVAALSTTWSASTSFGFDSTSAGIRQAVIVNQGRLVIINQAATGTKQASVVISKWNGLCNKLATYRICWQPGQVDLYANNELAATYKGTLVPSVALGVRFVADTGRLTVNHIGVVSGTAAVDPNSIAAIDMAQWNIVNGSSVTVEGGKLVLRSTAQAAAEVRSKGEFLFKAMDFTAGGDWGTDSSIGFERTSTSGRQAIEVCNGQYRISNPMGSRNDDIVGWATAKSQDSAFRIKWQNGFSQLMVNTFLKSAYSGEYLPADAVKVRFYVGTADPGEMTVDSVCVKDTM